MYIADLLSRAYIVKPLKDDIEMTELVHSLTKHLQISESRKKEIKEATLSDVGLSHVLKFWNEGWPSNGQNISPEAWEYFKFRDNIYVEEGLVFLNDRVIVPVSLRSEMLNILHQAHCGMEKAKARARQVLFWPGITKDIENMVSKCKTCERYRPRNVKEPLICHEVPNLPYEKIGTDICEHGGNSYLIIGCYLSKWLDIIKLSNKTSDEIIAKVKAVFSIHGIPKIIVCDNMPFASIKMKKFYREWRFEIVNSSPRYAKSNCFAEKMVGIAKSILRKAGTETNKISEVLLAHRNTPISGTNVSPAQVLMSICLRTRLPATNSVLQSRVIKKFRADLKLKRDKSKHYYDKQAHGRPEFNEGESVLFWVNNHWEPAEIIKKYKTPRSYLIRTEKGRILRRNSFHLKHCKNPFQLSSYDEFGPERVAVGGDDITIPDSEERERHSQDTENILKRTYITRKGRTVRPPSRLRDFVM
ncbi:Uncharacterized protein K02A2.6 [Araneus ventricosus]|uniref:RNA-directed DNA polymerase n=1 Tax=Araneus ventricosus TaxID=182803 RepID=A0A4Y2AS26_ARAVE|nr:Uncharacterized protein K02A2.6 [Araneus ventricosus]